MNSVDFIDLQVKLQNLSIWLEKLYEDVDKSLSIDGIIDARYYDGETIISKLVPTIIERLSALENAVSYNLNNTPSINILGDVNFSDNNWRLISSTGDMFISPISSTDKQDLSNTFGVDFNKIYGLTYKLVIDNLPNNNKDDAILVYEDNKQNRIYPLDFIYNTGFCKINNNQWIRIDSSFRPTNIRNNALYQIAIGNYTSIQLVYPVVTIFNHFNGGIL